MEKCRAKYKAYCATHPKERANAIGQWAAWTDDAVIPALFPTLGAASRDSSVGNRYLVRVGPDEKTVYGMSWIPDFGNDGAASSASASTASASTASALAADVTASSSAVLEKEFDGEVVKYVLFPTDKGHWMVRAVPVVLKSFVLRQAMPEKWRGKNGLELEKISGIAGAIFTHHSGFLGSNKTLDGALDMARRSMSLLLICPQKDLNWIGLQTTVPDPILQGVPNLRAQYPTATTRSEPGLRGEDPYHVTVCYGFDPKHHPAVRQMTMKAAVCDSDLKWGEPYAIEPPHLAAKRQIVLCVDVTSPTLEALKRRITQATGAVNPAEAQHARTLPFHVTLAILQRPQPPQPQPQPHADQNV
jgi:hypothetical protein